MNSTIKIISKIVNLSTKVFCGLIISFTVFYFFINYKLLPETIPSDFGPGKSPIEFSDRVFLIKYLLITAALYVSIFLFRYTKRLHFYPIKITNNNREFQFELSIISLRLIASCIIMFLCEISVYLSEIGLNRSRFHGWIDISLLYIAIGIISIGFIILSIFNRKLVKQS